MIDPNALIAQMAAALQQSLLASDAAQEALAESQRLPEELLRKAEGGR
jgi:hypothetical protein